MGGAGTCPGVPLSPGVALSPSHCSSLLGTDQGRALQRPRADLQVPLAQEHLALPEACEDRPLEAGGPAREEAHRGGDQLCHCKRSDSGGVLTPLRLSPHLGKGLPSLSRTPRKREESAGATGPRWVRPEAPCLVLRSPAGSLGSKTGIMGVRGLLPSLRLRIYTRDEKNEPLGF